MQSTPLERVCLDSSGLLGSQCPHLVAAATLRYYSAFWSPWIISEFVRLRTEWIANRAVGDGCDRPELRRRLRLSRQRINLLLTELSNVLQTVNPVADASVDLSWLTDADDWPIMHTALTARADTLVTDNTKDFPIGEVRNGVTFLSTNAFLTALYSKFPEAEAPIAGYVLQSRNE